MHTSSAAMAGLCAVGLCMAGIAAVQAVAPDLWHGGEAPRTGDVDAEMLNYATVAAIAMFVAVVALWSRRRALEAI